MKRLLLALSIAVLVISGCAPQEPTGNDGPKTEAPPTEAHTATLAQTTAPQYFVPLARFPDGRFFGIAGVRMTAWNAETGETKDLGHAWSGVLSPDGQRIAFQGEKGLHMLEVQSGHIVTVTDGSRQNGSFLNPGLWSPDAKKIVYMYVMEWSSDYFVYNVETGTSSAYEFKNIPNFLTAPVDWLEDRLLFVVHANKSRTGEQEYTENGYRSDLMLADTEGNFSPITRLEDGQFVHYCGATRDNDTFMVLVREEHGRSFAGLVNPYSEEIKRLPVEDNPVAGSISPNGKFAIFITQPNPRQLSVGVFNLQNKKVILEKEIPGYERPLDFIWDDTGHTVYFGMPGGNDNGVLYTVHIN